MRVLVIGSGAREHALLQALHKDPGVNFLAVAPGNAGTATVAEQYDVDATSPQAVTELAQRLAADLVVIGPEVPLVRGVADGLRALRAVEGRRPHRGLESLRQGRDGRRRGPDRNQ